MSCVWVLQRGHIGDGCDLASTLCKHDLRKGDLFVLSWAMVQRVRRGKSLFRAANVWWRCAQYFVIASCGYIPIETIDVCVQSTELVWILDFKQILLLLLLYGAVCPERSCDRVVLCRLCKRVSSSLMDGGRLLSTLLSFILPIAVLTNGV